VSGWGERRLHLIGIGGAGMSGLAAVCAELGATVSGSDRAGSSYTERLAERGVEVWIGHDAERLDPAAEVIVSTAIEEQNPELRLARERRQSVRHRGELLAELCTEKRLIAIAGTHGKTTTTAMVAWALRQLGADPAYFIGGELPAAGPAAAAEEPAAAAAGNAGWGGGEWVVAEADESDASFLSLLPEVAVITNIELDHHSRWSTLGELRAAFGKFAQPATAVIVGPGAELSGAAAQQAGPHGGAPREFGPDSPGPAQLNLAVPGAHNRLNARAALAALEAAGFDPDAAGAALADFPGVRRRLELKGTCRGARVYDDYAHHPTEVRAALSALRELEPSRLIAIFQPHLYSRTRAMAAEFGAALALADEIGVLDVYAAREEPVGELAGVSGLDVANAAADRAGGRPVWWLVDADRAERALLDRPGAGRKGFGGLGPGQIVVTLGAGDITKLSDRLVAE